MAKQQADPTAPFLVLASVALAIGLYARFKGLGFAPIAIDEYYLSHAVDGILKFGYPRFECGGLYQRGSGLQYLIAGLRLAGFSPELAPRFVAAVASTLTLPAVYLITKRFLSANLALVVATLLALSLWEIEMARFGRFYAPFQAVFCWYLVYFLKYAVDGNRSAAKAMLLLTAVAALTWEGAFFIALANFVPALITVAQSGRLSKQEWLLPIANLPLLAILFVLGTVYLGTSLDPTPHPPGYTPEIIELPSSRLDLVQLPNPASSYLVMASLALLLLAICAPAIWQHRSKPLAMLGLLAVVVAALAHQFMVIVAIAVLLLMLQQLSVVQLRQRSGIIYLLAVALTCFAWVVYSTSQLDWQDLLQKAGGQVPAIAIFLYQFVRFPDIVTEVVRPFAATVPWLSAFLLIALCAAVIREATVSRQLRSPEKLLTIVLILLLLAVGASDPPRQETRYSFFLYPLCLMVAVGAITRLVANWKRLSAAAVQLVAAGIALGLFVASEDFNLHHNLTVDSRASTFRTGMSVPMQAHLGEARDDYRRVADWLRDRVTPQRDIVINGVHGLNYYYTTAKYFFTERNGGNYQMWSCRAGTIERWSNLPLLSTMDEIRSETSAARTAYLITWDFEAPQLLQELADRRARLAFQEGATVVIALDGATSPIS